MSVSLNPLNVVSTLAMARVSANQPCASEYTSVPQKHTDNGSVSPSQFSVSRLNGFKCTDTASDSVKIAVMKYERNWLVAGNSATNSASNARRAISTNSKKNR